MSMIQAILTDIEGTTSLSLAFVKDVLFPYSRTNMAEFVRARAHEPRCAPSSMRSATAGRTLTIEEASAQFIAWIDADKKSRRSRRCKGSFGRPATSTATTEGPCVRGCRALAAPLEGTGSDAVRVSSGSVLAQKLLFGHTAWGDLTPLFSGYFDTTIGNKREAAAYHAIAGQIGLPPSGHSVSVRHQGRTRRQARGRDADRLVGYGTTHRQRDPRIHWHTQP